MLVAAASGAPKTLAECLNNKLRDGTPAGHSDEPPMNIWDINDILKPPRMTLSKRLLESHSAGGTVIAGEAAQRHARCC